MRVPAKELKVKMKKAVVNQRLTKIAWRKRSAPNLTSSNSTEIYFSS
jgi:hypothetical protein